MPPFFGENFEGGFQFSSGSQAHGLVCLKLYFTFLTFDDPLRLSFNEKIEQNLYVKLNKIFT